MISYFDTSVLVPAIVSRHVNHEACVRLLHRAKATGEPITSTNHTLAEMYTTLTKLPEPYKLLPKQALLAIQQLLTTYFSSTIDLDRSDYLTALEHCAARQLVSGVIYDALHLQAAIKAEAEVLYSANLRDFERLWTDELPIKLVGVG